MTIRVNIESCHLQSKNEYLNIILTDKKRIAIRNTIYNLPCIYDLSDFSKKLYKAALNDENESHRKTLNLTQSSILM